MKKLKCLCILSLVFISLSSYAEVKIEFPQEELSTESVLPVFEERTAVRNRRVKHAKKFELNLMAGMVVSEPLYNPLNFGLSLTYHFNNTSGIHIMGATFLDGLTSSGESLKGGDVFGTNGNTGAIRFDASEAPHKNLFIAAHYQYTAYYGKISLTRDSIMNLTLSGLIGGGAYMMDGIMAPSVNFGMSQRFYFTSSVALRFDLLFSIFNGPDVTSAGRLDPLDNVKPDPGDFEKAVQFDSNIYLGISFLL